MKKIFLIVALIITGLSLQIKAQDYYDRGYDNSYNNAGYDNDGFGYFYTSLSPYGTWIEFNDGVYGWKPVNMVRGWEPYSNGRWLWTSDGWYWDSYEPFGYIVFHYGRWYFDNYYGWLWIPDYQWAPAWVEWRYDDAYIGWAPLPPYAIFSVSIGIQFTHVFYTPYAHWNFVKYNYFCDPYVGKYYVGANYKYRIFSKTKYRHDYGYRNGRVINNGVDLNLIRQRGKIDIRERNIRTVSGLRDINNGNRVTDTEVRTFIPGKSNFTGARVKDVKIERADRKTTLETSKLEFGRKNIDRKETPVSTNNSTTTREVNKNTNVRIEKNSSAGSINQNRNPEPKKTIQDTRIKNSTEKEVKKPVQRTTEKKDSRTVAPGRTETNQKVEKKSSTPVVRNNNTKVQTKTNNIPVQQRTEVKVNTRSNVKQETTKNQSAQRQGNNRSEVKKGSEKKR